jgi:chromosome segregation protein
MFLKRITVSGFKSFADKVDFDFGPGVTCIVGPNGCGKSNVVDAFKWVLGEQSAKSLRGKQMNDMIFNGSGGRKASSYAQVDLVFDNKDRTLPLDQDDVTVTRKLYRSGESEYQLTKHAVRLKDIRELFMDTGVGTTAYSVIEQGRVDILLQSNPLERRAIFEEAAGISKYKARRREAERKLERTQQNLDRVGDIVDEVERRLRSVKVHAGKARNFLTYETRLKELRATYSMAEYHKLTAKIAEHDEAISVAEDQSTGLRTRIDRNEAETTNLTSKIDDVERDMTANDAEVTQHKSEITALEERIVSARHRIQEQTEHLENTEQRCAQQSDRLEQFESQLESAQQQARALQDETHKLHARIDELHAEDRTLAADFTEAQATLEDIKAGSIELLRRGAQLSNEIAGLTKHSESLTHQKGRLSERDRAIHEELTAVLERKNLLEQKLKEVDELIQQETRRLEEKKIDAQRVEETRSGLADALGKAKEDRSGLISRRHLLNDLDRKMEGVGAAVRQVLDYRNREAAQPVGHEPSNIAGMVAELIDAPVEHASVIEAAIGELDQSVVVRSATRFLDQQSLLGDLASRLSVVCLDRLPPMINQRDFSQEEGFVARASDLVTVDPEFDHLRNFLLGKAVIVDTLDNARTIAHRDVAGHRFITLAGEVIEPNGLLRVGPPGSHAGLISRKSELRDIEEQLETLDRRIESLDDQLHRTTAETKHLEMVRQELRTAIYEANTARVEVVSGLQNVEETIRRLTTEQPLIAGEVEAIERELNDAAQREVSTRADLKRIEEEKQRRERDVSKWQGKIDQLAEKRTAAQERLTEARVQAGQLGEKRTAAADHINNLRRNIQEAKQIVKAGDLEMEEARRRITESENAILSADTRLNQCHEHVARLESVGIQLRRQREMLRLEIESLAASTKQCRNELEQLEATLNQSRMARNESVIRRDELTARVREDLDLDLAALYQEYEHAEQDWQQIEEEIADLRAKIDRLGNVNLDAISEQEELEQRLAFLTGQREDLNEARRQLEDLINRLNHESITRFTETFHTVRENFIELFRKLFGGGRADIILEDPEQILECGIEIIARPPGKEARSISLLSGGEKSMTAIALLMSIFRSRPAPFALMDEVDAALDEANNERFNTIVREFLDRSQFIIITHSKRTMTIADQMYGVTMQEAGVSTRVGVQFDHDSDDPIETAVA